MSKYSGKCDFYDMLSIHSNSNDWDTMYDHFAGTRLFKTLPDGHYNNQFKDFFLHNTEEIIYNSALDLAPYFTYLVALSGVMRSDPKHSIVVISKESFVYTEERQYLSWILKDCIRYYNRCKKNHVPFVVEDCTKNIAMHENQQLITEIANRVCKYGLGANIEDLHDQIHTYYRDIFNMDMKKYMDAHKIAV